MKVGERENVKLPRVSVLQRDMRTYRMEAIPASKQFFNTAERFVYYANIRKETLTNAGVMQIQGTQCHRQAPEGKLSEALNINFVKTNTNLKPWKAT